MKVSASIEIAMQLASQEAIAAHFREIEAEHILTAVLKVSELPVEEVGKNAPGSSAAKDLAIEVSVLRERLGQCRIDSKRVRRKLREKLESGQNRYNGGVLHRSQTSRNIFDAAAKIASDVGSEALTIVHLFDAIRTCPTQLIAKVLAELAPGAGAADLTPRAPKGVNTPVLDKAGHNLVQLVASEPSSDATKHKAECRVLVESLSRGNKNGILLATDSEEIARSVVMGLAGIMAGKGCPKALRAMRLMDVSSIPCYGGNTSPEREQMEKVFDEARAAKSIILYVPPILTGRTSNEDWWLDMLRSALLDKQTQFICWTTNVTCKQIVKDAVWRRHAHILRIHEERRGELPNRL